MQDIEHKINLFVQSVKIIQKNLTELGYKFQNQESAVRNSDYNIEKMFVILENHVGNLPESIKILYRRIGSINFMGHHPSWSGCEYPDPLYIDPFEAAIEELNIWLEERELDSDFNENFRFPISPDFYHKEDVSGGLMYSIELPNEDSDPLLLDEWHETTLLRYLGICLEWGGFPGLERDKTIHNWPIDKIKEGLSKT